MRSLGFKRGNAKDETPGHNLTSLVDCFAIILIYLLMATSIGDFDLDIPDGMKLPKASKSQAASPENAIIQIKGRTYVLKGRTIPMSGLVSEFKRIFDSFGDTKPALIVEADKSASYAEINPVVIAGLQVGFESVQFAVLKED